MTRRSPITVVRNCADGTLFRQSQRWQQSRLGNGIFQINAATTYQTSSIQCPTKSAVNSRNDERMTDLSGLIKPQR